MFPELTSSSVAVHALFDLLADHGFSTKAVEQKTGIDREMEDDLIPAVEPAPGMEKRWLRPKPGPSNLPGFSMSTQLFHFISQIILKDKAGCRNSVHGKGGIYGNSKDDYPPGREIFK